MGCSSSTNKKCELNIVSNKPSTLEISKHLPIITTLGPINENMFVDGCITQLLKLQKIPPIFSITTYSDILAYCSGNKLAHDVINSNLSIIKVKSITNNKYTSNNSLGSILSNTQYEYNGQILIGSGYWANKTYAPHMKSNYYGLEYSDYEKKKTIDKYNEKTQNDKYKWDSANFDISFGEIVQMLVPNKFNYDIQDEFICNIGIIISPAIVKKLKLEITKTIHNISEIIEEINKSTNDNKKICLLEIINNNNIQLKNLKENEFILQNKLEPNTEKIQPESYNLVQSVESYNLATTNDTSLHELSDPKNSMTHREQIQDSLILNKIKQEKIIQLIKTTKRELDLLEIAEKPCELMKKQHIILKHFMFLIS